MNSIGSVVFVDDDEAITRRLVARLQQLEPAISYHAVYDDSSIAQILNEQSPEVLVVDLNLDPFRGPEGGLEVIAAAHRLDPTARIIALTGHDAATFGVRALQRGAASFLEKPADLEHLMAIIRDGICYAKLKRSHIQTQQTPQHLTQRTGLRSQSKIMLEVIDQVAYAATTRQPVLLIGETGVGKGIIAQAIHRAGKCSQKNFVRFQSSFTSHDLVASELFGHKRGSFTGATDARQGLFAEAMGGTLFIDEVDQLPGETQVLLLDALQNKTYRPIGSSASKQSDFRLLSATNRPEQELINSRGLREDFYHRIAHCTIRIPPLRERSEDIAILAEEFLQALSAKEKLNVQGLTPETLNYLSGLSWPGNIRQLQAVVEGAGYRASYEQQRYVELSHLALQHSNSMQAPGSFRSQVRTFEKTLVRKALSAHGNNQSRAAAALQLDRSSLRRILDRQQ